MSFYTDVIVKAMETEGSAWAYLFSLGMMRNSTCLNCNVQKDVIWDDDAFRCNICGKQEAVEYQLQSLTSSRMTNRQMVLLLFEICRPNNTICQISEVCGVPRNTVSAVRREICLRLERWIVQTSSAIGGFGKLVEIDEAFLGRRKNNRGSWRNRRQQEPLLGMVERGSGDCCLIPVVRRTIAELYPLIVEHVLPGTTIITDQWRSYNAVSRDPDYVHFTVNHSVTFVSPEGYHINTVEGSWAHVRKALAPHKNLDRELVLFMARRKCLLKTASAFYKQVMDVITNDLFLNY